MNIDANSIAMVIVASAISGLATAIYSAKKEAKLEKAREAERYQDNLRMELKDLKIQLYQLEKDLSEWKDKYYSTIEELIGVKSELEETLIKLSLIDMHFKES